MSQTIDSLPAPNRFGPFCAGQILERTAGLMRDSPKIFLGIGFLAIAAAGIAGMVFGFASLLLRHLNPDGSPAARILALAPLALLCFGGAFIVAQVAQGAFFWATRSRLMDEKTSVGDACSAASHRLGTLAGVAFFVALRIIGYLLAFYLVFAIVFGILIAAMGGMRVLVLLGPGHTGNTAAVALLLVLAFVFLVIYLLFLVWLISRYSLSVPAAMEEGLPAGDAIRRSIALSHRAKGRIIALLVFVFGVNIAVALVSLPVQLLALRGAGTHPHVASPAGLILIGLVTVFRFLVAWIVSVFLGIGLVLCYFDLRVRKEGFGAPSAQAAAPGTAAFIQTTPPVLLPDSPGKEYSTGDGPEENLPVS
jgi:hypothetical protein